MENEQRVVCATEILLLIAIMIGVWYPYMDSEYASLMKWWKPCNQSEGYYCTNYSVPQNNSPYYNWTNATAIKEWVDWYNKIHYVYAVNYSTNWSIDMSNCTEIPCDCWKEGCLVLCLRCY